MSIDAILTELEQRLDERMTQALDDVTMAQEVLEEKDLNGVQAYVDVLERRMRGISEYVTNQRTELTALIREEQEG